MHVIDARRKCFCVSSARMLSTADIATKSESATGTRRHCAQPCMGMGIVFRFAASDALRSKTIHRKFQLCNSTTKGRRNDIEEQEE